MSEIRRLKPSDQENEKLKSQFIDLFKTTFADEPYFEKHSEESIVEIWNEHFLENSVVIVAESKGGDLLGFGCGQPLKHFQGLINHLTERKVELKLDLAFYLSELAVSKSCRNMGLGTSLTAQVIKFAQEGKFSPIVTITAHQGSPSLSIFKKVGFQLLSDADNYMIPDDDDSTSRQRVVCVL